MQNKNKQAQNTILCLCIFTKVKVFAGQRYRNRIVTPSRNPLIFRFSISVRVLFFCFFSLSFLQCASIKLNYLNCHRWLLRYARETLYIFSIDAKSIAFGMLYNVNIPHVHLAFFFHFAHFGHVDFRLSSFFLHGNMSKESIEISHKSHSAESGVALRFASEQRNTHKEHIIEKLNYELFTCERM